MNDKNIFLKHQAQTTPFPFLLEVESAEGSYIKTKDGKNYLDMIAGVAVNNIGHRHPKVIENIRLQLDKYLHVMVYGEYVQEMPSKLAFQLKELLPYTLNCSYFVNSGTEANEAAMKLAKRITGRTEIIALKGAYHGSTHGSLSVSSNEEKKFAFRPLLPDIRFIGQNKIDELNKISENTAAVIIETIQGDAGVRIPDQKWLEQLRKKCTQTGAQLIFDEIQCGMGRTGKMFAFEHFNVIPDILTIGKAMAGGLPMGTLISSHEKMKLLTVDPMLGHITTFGGNPLVCAAASATMEVLPDLLPEVEKKGQLLEDIIKVHPQVKSIRRIGLMFAIDLDHEDKVQQVVDYCLEQELISFWFLSCPWSFRLSPPLNIKNEDLRRAGKIIFDGLQQIK